MKNDYTNIHLQFTFKWIILDTAGGTSFFAMHKYAPICRRSTLWKLISSPSTVSLRRVLLLLTFVIIGLPSSLRHMIPTYVQTWNERNEYMYERVKERDG